MVLLPIQSDWRPKALHWMPLHWRPWAVAFGVNLVLFVILGMTARFKVDFQFVETERRTPIVIMSKTEFDALRERRTAPDTPIDEPTQTPADPAKDQPVPETEIDAPPEKVSEDLAESGEEVVKAEVQLEQEPERVSEASSQPEIEAPATPPQEGTDDSEEEDNVRLTEPDFSKIDYVKPPPRAAASDPFKGLTGQQIDELYKKQAAARRALAETRAPNVDLPEGEAAATGIVAIRCYEVFEDAEKAAECAGREILSGWQAKEGQFDRIQESMRQGDAGAATPYGPSVRAPLKRGEEYYGKSKVPQILLGPKAAKDLEDAVAIRALKDARRGTNAPTTTGQGYDSMGIDDPIPTSSNTFTPSWVLRDDPDLDLKDVERIMNEAELDRREKARQ